MREWLSCHELGRIEGITGDAVKRRIYKGKYCHVKRERPGRGGKSAWLISIYDPAVPQDIRDLFERQATKFLGLPSSDDIQRLTALLAEVVKELQRNTAQLEWVIRKLK